MDIRQFFPGIRVDIYETKNIGLCVRERERERERGRARGRKRKGWAGFCGYIGTLRLSETKNRECVWICLRMRYS